MSTTPPDSKINAVLRFIQTTRGRTILILAAVLVVMAFGLYWGVTRMLAPVGSSAPSKKGCVMVPASMVRATSVQVDVFNGAGVSGLGAEVAGKLRSAGFNVANVSNAADLREKTAIISRDKESPQAQLVATFFPGAELVQDNRYAGTVDVVLGKNSSAMNLKAPARIEVPAHEKCALPGEESVSPAPSATPSS